MGTSASIISDNEKLKVVSVPAISERTLHDGIIESSKFIEITIQQTGFSKDRITIPAGQTIVFTWFNEQTTAENENSSEIQNKSTYSVIQVIEDDIEGRYRPVIGGFNSGKPTIKASYAINFKLMGEYKFKIKNHPKDPLPFTVNVIEEQPINAQITDDGFYPKFIKIDEGRSIKWDWSYCGQPHSIYEAEYCNVHNGLYRISKELVVPTCSNTYKRTFDDAGLYYFQTESRKKGQQHVCVIEVADSFRDHKIDILDSRFSPMLLTIEEGDRVWFTWTKEKCLKKHAIYEINLPTPNHPTNEPYLEKQDGFKWLAPTRNGLLCHRFETCGVYYYSDTIENESASYIGIIVVKPKSASYDVFINTNSIEPDILPIEAGDRVWWKWDPKNTVNIKFLDSSLLYDKKMELNKCQTFGDCEEIDTNLFSRFGINSLKISKPGVYYYSIEVNGYTIVSNIVASPPPKDHKIEISDTEFVPNIINVNPEDRVWFVWTDTKRSHNIRQVTHQNQIMKNGFLSGCLMEAPGAFMHTFSDHGIFYFRSDGLKNCVGAIVVVPEPTIQVIHVTNDFIEPDPIVANVFDAILWVFPTIQTHELVEIKTQNDLLTYPLKAQEIISRRCLSRSFKDANIYHFASPSFNKALKKEEKDSKGYKNIVLSSVIVDKKYEYVLVSVDLDGFHPDYLNIPKNKSVLFDWKESNERHNIIHVKKSTNQGKLELVEGSKAFSSKQLTLNDNFLYTFEEEGEYHIASEGAPGQICLINVLDRVEKTATPKLVNREPSLINKYHKIHLHCDTIGASIYYTTDGMQPNRNSPSLKRYDPENGILLTEIGFCFIRAIAISEGLLMSDIFTSQRFFVIENLSNREEMYAIEEADVKKFLKKPLNMKFKSNSDWWRAIPKLNVNNLGDGVIEIIWEKPFASSLDLISHYQLFLNRISYKQRINSDVNRLIVRGLSGGRTYDVNLMVFPKLQSLLPQQSNVVRIKCLPTSEAGGPLISLKANSNDNQITIVWQSIDTFGCPIDFYQLIINDEKKEMIKSGNKYNKVIIDGFEPNLLYTISVIAVPKNSLIPLNSNEIQLLLPLNLNEISLPDPALRENNKDLYDEYIEIEDYEFKPRAKKVAPIQKVSTQLSKEVKTQIDIAEVEEHLPIPKVSVSHLRPGAIAIEWILTKLPHSPIELLNFIVSLIGTEFGNLVKSDSSFDCFMEINGIKIPAVQHCWNLTKVDNSFVIDGIIDSSIYQICIIAVYTAPKNNQITELKKPSATINYCSLGPPHPPKIRVVNIDLQSVTLEWSMYDYPKPEYISGYRLLVDSEYKEKFSMNQHEFIFNELKPGKAYKLEMVALTNSIIGQSEPSKPIKIICPKKPKAPYIYQSSTLRINSVVISWKPTLARSSNKEDQIWMYKIYLNEKFHGEIFSSNLSTYSYLICDLTPGQFYDVTIKALCGQRIQLPCEDDTVYCLIASDPSNLLPVTPTAPPSSPVLKLESIHPGGIDLTWNSPQQYGEASLSGYQLVINGKIQNKVISTDSLRTTISDIKLGDTVNLQIMALTNHPCGQFSLNENHPNYNLEYALMHDSIDDIKEMNYIYKDNRYSACKPGPSLVVRYTNLVLPVANISIEKITGHSVVLIWQIINNQNIHYIIPEYYSISYWPSDSKNERNIKSLTTKNDYIHLNGLRPSTSYTIIVESRKESKRSLELNNHEQIEYTYLYYSKSESFSFITASPPDAPSNLSVVTTTCHGLRICWDLPRDNGSEVIATRIDCYPVGFENSKNIVKELTPDLTECIVENLNEKTKYRINVTTITEEYLVEHNIKDIKQLSKHKLEPISWLPRSSIDVVTAGTDPALNLKFKINHDNSYYLNWKSPKVYGSNILLSQILCYHELSSEDQLANQIVLPANVTNCQLNGLKIGSKYKTWIEAVVSVKLSLDIKDEKNELFAHYNEIKDRRITHVISDVIEIRAPAPCEQPVLLLTGYSTTTIDLYWKKPLMCSEHIKPNDSDENYIINRRLLGYRIEVNGIKQKELGNQENTCTLTNCKPSNHYNVVLIARTCLADSINISCDADEREIDESYSQPLQITLPFENDISILKSIRARFEEAKDDSVIGRIRINWIVPDTQTISQFNINWFLPEEALSQRKSLDPTSNFCVIPISKAKSICEITLDTLYKNSKSDTSEKLTIEIPGAPDAPKLWIKEKKDSTYILNWSEPRMHHEVPCVHYQLFINESKASTKIDAETHQASLPLKPNRVYKVAIQALTLKALYSDSPLSNTLTINTYMSNSVTAANNTIEKVIAQDTLKYDMRHVENLDKSLQAIRDFYNQENIKEMEECNLPVKIIKAAEDYVEIDWSNFVSTHEVNEFKIQWHCWNTNIHDEERVDSDKRKYIVKKLKAGHTYTIRIYALKGNNILNKSKFIIVQTCAPPDPPSLKLRACNFKYITIEWNKPNSYGEAIIVGYKIFIDEKATAVIAAEQTTFTLSNGEPCHEYCFQIQALTKIENLVSAISPALVVPWPGVKCPNMKLIEAGGSSVKFSWDEPKITGNAKISFCRVISNCEQTGQVLMKGPLDPHILECEFTGMDPGRHKIQLEVNMYGVAEPFYGTPLHIDFGYKPDAPVLITNVPAIDERIKLDNIACNLLNKRDRILKIIANNGTSKQYREITKGQLEKSMVILNQVDEALDDCLNLINLFTGYFIVNLSWHCLQSSKLMKINGYKVYLNGKQYGVDLPENVTTIRLKLSLDKVLHSIYVTSFCTNPFLESQASNSVDILTERFLQFSFYCYNHIHAKNIIWPKNGCCAFQDSISFERLNLARTRENINIGFFSIPQSLPVMKVFDLRTNQPASLIEEANIKNRANKIRVILFWAKWCLPSIRMLKFLVKYAQKNSSQYEFVACHHGNENPNEIMEFFKKTGFIDSNLKLYSDSSILLKIHDIQELSILDVYDIKGLPTLMIFNKNGLLAWKGRYCCYDFINFENFMNHNLSEVIDVRCPVINCEACIFDTNIDQDLNALRNEQHYLMQYKDTLIRPANSLQRSSSFNKSIQKQPKQLITIKERPYSTIRAEHNANNATLIRSNRTSNDSSSTLSDDPFGHCYYRRQKSEAN